MRREATLQKNMVDRSECPFCALPPGRTLCENALALAFRDGFPISPGHTLVIPKRHVASFFACSAEERAAMLELLERARSLAEDECHPDGYNIGINDGAAAGQTVMHVHVHLIPRYRGDAEDPRGGVRWVLPAKAKYWAD